MKVLFPQDEMATEWGKNFQQRIITLNYQLNNSLLAQVEISPKMYSIFVFLCMAAWLFIKK